MYFRPITIDGVLYETQWSHDRRVAREQSVLEKAKTKIRQKAQAPGLRQRLINRANGRCQICAFGLSHVLNLHHIYPVKLAGASSDRNLAAICPNCHAAVHYVAKSSHPQAIQRRVERLLAAGYTNMQAELIRLVASKDAHVLPDGTIEPYTDPEPMPFVIVDAPDTDPQVVELVLDAVKRRKQRAAQFDREHSHIARGRKALEELRAKAARA